MLTNRNKKRKTERGVFFPIILGLVTLSVMAFLVVSNWKISQKRSELKTIIENSQEEIKVLEKKNAELKDTTAQLSTQEYQEKVLREDLNYKKLGEEVVVIKMSTTTTEEVAREEKSFWQKFLEKIF